MSAVKDKIAKLLALATSPNEKEAKEALLKARELMAKHKLRSEECQTGHDAKVVEQTVDVECTKMTDPWVLELAAVIGNRYCCATFRRHFKGAKKVMVGFIGLEDDFEVCHRVYSFAYEGVKSRCREIRSKYRNQITTTELREMCNAYGWGFCRGLNAAFREQENEHQEWGLALTVPQAVKDVIKRMGEPSVYSSAKIDGWRAKYAHAGYVEGKEFVPGQQLEPRTPQCKTGTY